MRLAAGNFGLTPLLEEPGDDALAVISLDLDHAMLIGTARAAEPFQRFGYFVGFVRRKSINQTHDASAAAFARNADDPIGGHCGFGHAMVFG
jgi:hypothetical protein